MTPCRRPSSLRISRCSRVCGMTESSAATTSSGEVDAGRPGEHVLDEPLVAGHVDDAEAVRRRGRGVAKPMSMVMPRAFSSGSRSQSMPVSALTSEVLPWSMWPAVPRIRSRGMDEVDLEVRVLPSGVLYRTAVGVARIGAVSNLPRIDPHRRSTRSSPCSAPRSTPASSSTASLRNSAASTPAEVQKLADLIHERYVAGRFVFVIGNGGSGSNASHFCEDMGKGTLAREVLRQRHQEAAEDPEPDRQHAVHPGLGQRRGLRPRLRRAAEEPGVARRPAHRHQRLGQQPEHPAGGRVGQHARPDDVRLHRLLRRQAPRRWPTTACTSRSTTWASSSRST